MEKVLKLFMPNHAIAKAKVLLNVQVVVLKKFCHPECRGIPYLDDWKICVLFKQKNNIFHLSQMKISLQMSSLPDEMYRDVCD